MVEVAAVTVIRRGRHEPHEWHLRNTWRQVLCDLCLRLTIRHEIHVGKHKLGAWAINTTLPYH